MYLRCRPFWWPCGRVEAMHVASHNAAWPGTHQITLEATIGQLLALNLPGSCQGDRQQTMMKKRPPLLAISNIKAVVVRRYNTARIAWRRRSMASLEATGHHHWASTRSNNIHRTCLRAFFLILLSTCWNVCKAKGWLQITKGVWPNWCEAIK